MTTTGLRGRLALTLVAALVLAGVSVAYSQVAAEREADGAPAPNGTITLEPGPQLLTVTNRHISAVSLADPGGPRTVSTVECVRVYAAAGTGVCLRPDSPWSYELVVLDSALRQSAAFAVPGLPSRARVSPSGRLVAWTTFVGGDSYLTGGFSTRTGIFDTADGTRVTTLEDFAVTVHNQPYQSIDVNFWGVTFAADDNRFYATMSTAGHRFLVQGDFASRTVRTLTENVECPSLSPDGTRLAFKRAIDGDPANGWRLSILELATMRVMPLAETASVDDQAAWLDNATLAYTLVAPDGRPDIWSVQANGTGSPRLLVPEAESPAALALPAR